MPPLPLCKDLCEPQESLFVPTSFFFCRPSRFRTPDAANAYEWCIRSHSRKYRGVCISFSLLTALFTANPVSCRLATAATKTPFTVCASSCGAFGYICERVLLHNSFVGPSDECPVFEKWTKSPARSRKGGGYIKANTLRSTVDLSSPHCVWFRTTRNLGTLDQRCSTRELPQLDQPAPTDIEWRACVRPTRGTPAAWRCFRSASRCPC